MGDGTPASPIDAARHGCEVIVPAMNAVCGVWIYR